MPSGVTWQLVLLCTSATGPLPVEHPTHAINALLCRRFTLQARGYKNTALSSLFMMNNVHYIQWSVETSPAAVELLGSAWLERHKDLVEEWGAGYHDATWMPLVHMLKVGRGVCGVWEGVACFRRDCLGCAGAFVAGVSVLHLQSFSGTALAGSSGEAGHMCVVTLSRSAGQLPGVWSWFVNGSLSSWSVSEHCAAAVIFLVSWLLLLCRLSPLRTPLA